MVGPTTSADDNHMLENSEPTKIVITCRFIQHDQWLTTHVDPSWTIRQLKLWLVHRLFQISIPPRIFISTQNAGKAAERPPSPITFAPDPRMRPASPIVFAPPKQQKRQGGRGWLSDTTEEDGLTDEADEGDESSGPPSYGVGAKGKGTQVRVSSHSSFIPGGRIGPRPPSSSSQHNGGLVVITEPVSGHSARGNTIVSPVVNAPVPDDRYPGGVNHHHWSLMRYSTGQILIDDEALVSWYDINEYELLELHGLSFPSTHPLYEYQVYHLWNPDRHRERERLRKKLKKRFEAEVKEGGGGGKSAAQQAQILKAMNLNSGAGANVGVVEYYGEKLATKVQLTLTRIPRAIDTYVQPYWEGWVRTLRIVWKGDWNDVAATGVPDPYRYGVYNSGNPTGAFGIGVNIYHNPTLGEGPRESLVQQQRPEKIVRVEWRERWVRIQNGTLAVLRDRENEEATHVLPLKDILSLTNTQHLVRYLSYTGFNPPLDHPAVTPDILMPALNLPIPPPPQPAAVQDDDDSDRDQSTHHSSQHGHSSSLGGSKEYNFTFPNFAYLSRHIKARELTPLVGSRFDPTYLPVTIEEQLASGLRIVCLQFRKSTSLQMHSGGGDGEERGIDPVTLALEDMRERAGEWGGIRSNNSLWRCLPRLKGEPPYISRVKMRMRMRGGRGGSKSHGTSGSSSTRNTKAGSGGGGDGGRIMSERNSTIRGLRDPDWGYSPPQQRHTKRSRVTQHSKRSMASITSVGSTPTRKERIYELERESQRPVHKPKSRDKELDINALLAAQIFGAQPNVMRSQKEVVEDRERREKKERQKREKELEKERMKHEKEREKGKGKEKEKDGGEAGKDKDKDRDWNLGSLNVAFWNWGKKKKAKKQQAREIAKLETGSTSTLQLDPRGTSRPPIASETSISSGVLEIALPTNVAAPTVGSSTTVVASVPAASSEDEDDRAESETSIVDDTSDDDGGEEEREVEAVEPYPHECPPDENEEDKDDENDEEIEYADLPSNSQHHDSPPPHAVLTEEELDQQLDKTEYHNTSNSNANGGTGVPSVVVQVAVDKRVEHEEDVDNQPRTVAFGVQKFLPERDTLAPLRAPAVTKPKSQVRVQTHIKTRVEESGHSRLAKKPSERLIGQLHSSDEEHGEGEGVAEDDDAELSSPVFAPPPPQQKTVRQVKSASTFGVGSGGAKSLSSHSSVASADYEEDDEAGFDEDLDDDLFAQRRAGYRYGAYDTRREEEKRKRAGYEKELEEQRERELKIREQREWEARQKEREREEKEREKERERRKKKEDEGEWVCLDLGNDFAFQSFLRIIHQHCPHPMNSSFMQRMIGGPLDDAPPPPQKLPRIPHPYPESTSNSVGPSSPNAHMYHSHFQPEPPPRPGTSDGIHFTLESRDTPSTRFSVPNSPTSPRSQHTTSSHTSFRTPPSRHALSQSPPSRPSVPPASPPSSQFTPPPSQSPTSFLEETDSDAEYIAPLPGYGDPRFTYPSRTPATLPYPEWRLNILCKAQRAGMGDVGRAMELIHWGKEDPVISEASGAVGELERFGKRWGGVVGGGGGGGGLGMGRYQSNKGKCRDTGEGGEDNVSSLGTIGPKTVGSSGTVKGVSIGSPSKNRKRLSLGGNSARNSSIPESPREGGESGNESSAEDSDGSIGGMSTASSAGVPGDGSKKRKKEARTSQDLQSKLTRWSDDSDEEQSSELEWLAWQIDIRRQAKRQYAIQARREANAMGTSRELDLGLPVHPADDMKRFLENRQKLEPSATITLPRIPPDVVEVSSSSVSVSHSLSGGTPTIAASTASTRIVTDTLSPHHARTPSQQQEQQQHHTLHHSASLHTGLRKGGAQDQPARRPSMPILYPREERERELKEKEKERDKGKGKEWSFWPQFGTGGGGGGYPSEDLRSPTSGWFSSSKKDGREMMLSPGGSGSQPPSASGSVGRSGSMLLKGHLLGKKGSADIMRERERERERDRERELSDMDEESELKRHQRPQLRVATSSSTGTISGGGNPEASKSPEQVKSPTFVPKSFVRRMRSDASILSLRAGDTTQEGPSSPHQQGQQQSRKRKGPMDRFMSSTFDFVDGK